MSKYNNIKVLDCTLRDGGHVNNADFGKKIISLIIDSLIKSRIDLIELGFLRNGVFTEDQTTSNTIQETESYIKIGNPKTDFSVMIRPDWYDIRQLTECTGKIRFIRFAFYYKDIDLTEKYTKYARDKGYKVILNPVNVMGYDEKTLIDLLKHINDIRPYGTTIVDTFGALQQPDLMRIYNFYEKYISEDMTIGLHLHENMSTSFSLAQYFLSVLNPNRSIIIDASLLGMGRIPGNLCIEVLLDFLNTNYSKNYDLLPILAAISSYIQPIKDKIPWGYSPAYYFTGKYAMHRSYAEYLLTKSDIDLSDIFIILNEIKNSAYASNYNEAYVKDVYTKYKSRSEK